ncbi:hypothetical protein [Acinetobacter sp. ANC 5414]|uniref:hypothetical protein n=1 Tax=Acinetobacter sp. ANC 5414 TaxID=2731251 RepID=UPI0014900455|nr:hypothetical protein [Acinetobacter sp. ANC 5414]NNH01699.1 hypothetical protein [Acinetobacter sp. ANC 5414]
MLTKDLQFYADELAKSQCVSCSGFKPHNMMIIDKVRIELKPLDELLHQERPEFVSGLDVLA